MKFSPFAPTHSVVRSSPEAFYLHLGGAQQGPYTIPQIDHLLNSGLIAEETLYWREGLEQWQPVTSLIALRKKRRRWVGPAIAIGVALAFAPLAWIFGPVLIVGWQEANQHEFTATAAYWRARDLVRSDLRTKGMLVDFADFAASSAVLSDGAAEVILQGSTTDASRHVSAASWKVPMKFNAGSEEWSGSVDLQSQIAK